MSGASRASAQAPLRKIAELRLSILGVSATVEPANPTVPKNTPSGVRVVLRSGDRELSLSEAAAVFGANFEIRGDLAGPGLSRTIALPYTPSPVDDPEDPDDTLPIVTQPLDPTILPLPGLPVSGDYALANLRISAPGRPDFDVTPREVPLRVIEQVLVTSVKTRQLTLEEIQEKGIVLGADDYVAFEFALGLKLESEVVDMTFPVVFNREGVAVPQTISPPPVPQRVAPDLPLPTVVPVLFQVDDGEAGVGPAPRLPPLPGGGEPIRIPSVIVIPGNIGYLKSFFSAQLFVANGTPAGSGLVVDELKGTIQLPPGPDLDPDDTRDNPLALPNLQREGKVIVQPTTMPVRGLGPDGAPGTADDVGALGPGEQGQAEFLLRGEAEGFHTIDFDIRARLTGLVTGPVQIRGQASGGVLVRNPFFDVAFTVPGVVRAGERFTVFATLSNIGEGAAQGVFLDPDTLATSGVQFVGDPPPPIPAIQPGQSETLELEFLAQVTGQVTASYLRFEAGMGTGSLQLAVGIGPRGVPLSPDTLVLPTAVDQLPALVVKAAMRVLGQAWSVAGAPAGTLPSDIVRTSRKVVTEKALALAEAGLRVRLGQDLTSALRDVAFDFWGAGATGRVDPGFDQLLRESEAGLALADALGAALAERLAAAAPGEPGDVFALESSAAAVAASGPDFITFAVTDGGGPAPVKAFLVDGTGRETALLGSGEALPASEVESATFLPLGPRDAAPLLGVVPEASAGPYTVRLVGRASGSVQLSATFPRGDGTFARVTTPSLDFDGADRIYVRLDPARPTVEEEGWQMTELVAAPLEPTGPTLLAATVIGPETLDGASPFGFHGVLLFDRVVDPTTAEETTRYEIPRNGVLGAKRQLSGRLVFVSLEQPEGPHVPATLGLVEGLIDVRGNEGPAATVPLQSLLEDPGAVVTGRVFTAEGTPVAGGTVTYVGNTDTSCRYPLPKGLSAQELDGDGRYELRYVRQDNCGQPFWIATTDPATGGRRQVSARVRADGEVIELDLALLGRGAVTGTVRDVLGQPVPAANVVVVSETDPQIGGAAVTDGDGTYLVDGITVGPVVVRAGKGRGLGVATGRIDRAGTVATVDVTLDGDAVRVHGTVYVDEGETSTPLPGATVTYELLPQDSPYAQLLGVTETDAAGSYVFEQMPTGDYRISAALNARDRDSRLGTGIYDPSHPEGDRVDLHIVVPAEEEFATIEGTVFLPDGSPASDVVVTVGGRGVVSLDGTYSIPGVPVKSRSERVSAQSRDGRRSGSNTVVVTQARLYEGVDITLSGLGTAAFVVYDANGDPVGPGQSVALLGQCGDPCGCKATVTDSEGIARFDDLSLGQATAQALRSGPTFVDVARGSVTLFENDKAVVGSLRFAGTGAVSGTVTGPDGPVHGAQVTLVSKRFDPGVCLLVRGPSHRAATSLSGEYRFEGVNLGPVSVSAAQDFAGSAGNSGTLVQPGQDLVLDVELEDNIAGKLSGTVFLPDGVTPAGAGVEVTVEGPLPEVTVRTDGDGAYQFKEILPQGRWTLTARDPLSGGVARSRVTLAVGQEVVHNVRLLGRGTVRVTVVDGLDQPLEAALLRLKETDYPQRAFEASLRPGDAGLAVFENVFEGGFTVDVSDAFARGGGASGTVPGPGSTVDVKVTVTRTGTVLGHFLMPDQTPIPYGTVKLLSGGRVISQATTEGTGPDVGSFAFDYVPVGTVRVEAEDPLTARRGFQVGLLETESQKLTLDVTAQGLGRVFGEVTLNEDPQGLVAVELVSGDYRASTMTLGDGTYAVEGVPEGHVTVTASFAGGFLAGTASGTLEGEGGEVEIDVALREAGSIVGNVWRAGGGQVPAPTSRVALFVGGPGGGRQETTTRPEDGFFEFSRVPVGTATLTVDVLSSIDRAQQTVEVGPAQLVPVEIELQGVGSIRGQAVASEEEDAPGLAGWLTFSGPAFEGTRTIETGADGLFELPEVLAGEFTVTLRQGSGPLALYGTTTGVVSPDKETLVRVALQPSATVTGTVLRPLEDGPDRPAFGAEVTLDVTLGSGKRGQLTVQVQDDGSFEARGVPHGELTVSVYDPVSQGRARVPPQPLDTESLELGTLLLDVEPPTLTFLEPTHGTVRAALAGPVVLELADADTGVDPDSLVVTRDGKTLLVGASFAYDGVQATGLLQPQHLVIGENRLVARVRDVAGLVGETETTLTVTGATLRGCVLGSTGTAAPAGVPVTLNNGAPLDTDENGCYAFAGLRPGSYTVRATDPETGLTAQVGGPVLDGVDLQLPDLQLPAAARLTGIVLHRDGSAAEGVEVRATNRVRVTEGAGAFDLGHLALGTYIVDAYGPDGDRGRQEAVLDTLGAIESITIELNGVGSVEVLVKDANGVAVGGASVTVQSSSPFGGYDSGATGPDGTPAAFPRVLYGSLTVQADWEGLHGEEFPLLNQASLPVTVTLEAAGQVTGTATRQTGGAATGVTVRLKGSKQATTVTDSAGLFAFENVPQGDFTLALEGPDGDRGAGSGSIATPGQTVDVPVTMNGVGTVRTTVRDSGGAPVEGARVSVHSRTAWGLYYPQIATDADGVAVHEGVLAGPVDVAASHPSNGSQGSTSGTVPADDTVDLDIPLEVLGAVEGRVLAPNGVDPVEGARVEVGARGVDTDADGHFRIDDLKMGTYTLVARVDGRVRARVPGVELSEGSPVATQDLVLVWTSVVSGTVTAAAGGPAEGAAVRLHSQAASFGGYFDATTDAEGAYALDGVPVGDFTLTATLGLDRADGAGAVPPTGQPIEVNLQLQASAVVIPQTLKDGNTMSWYVQRSGAVSQGHHWNGTTPRLTVVRDGAPFEFTGPDCPATGPCYVPSEEDERELVLVQDDLGGLQATRKVLVARDGYFLRHLDLLHNPGAGALTVDVVEEADFGATEYVATSSGDELVSPEDRWVVLDDDDPTDIFDTSSYNWAVAPTAFVATGPGGVMPAVQELTPAGARSLLTRRWNGVEIPPGATVAFLHVVSAQSSRDRALGTAERLALLPPELLAGLEPEEAGAVYNAAVPPDLVSAVPPLPPNDGVIQGRVLGGDAETPVLGSSVRFRSRSLHYGRPLNVGVGGGGNFRVPSPTAADPKLVPREAFDLTASRSTGGLGTVSHTVSGDFPSSGVVDLTSVIDRAIRARTTASFSLTERAADGDLSTFWQSEGGDSASQGATPWLEVVLPGDATVRRVVLRGRRDGYALIHLARVEILDGAGSTLWSTELPLSDGDGETAVPPDVPGIDRGRSVRVTSLLDYTNQVAIAEIQVLGEADLGPTGRADTDVVLRGSGVVRGGVLRSDGTAVTGGNVTLRLGSQQAYQSLGNSSEYEFVPVPPGTYSLTASHPLGSDSVTVDGVEVPGPCQGVGETLVCAPVERDLVYPAFGALTVNVRTAAGGLTGASAKLVADGFSRSHSVPATTGSYTFVDVPPGEYTLTVTDSRSQGQVTHAVSLAASTPTVQDVELWPVGTLQVTATVAGERLEGGKIAWQADSRGPSWVNVSPRTSQASAVAITNVPGPTVRVRVEYPNVAASYGVAEAALTEEGQPVPVEVEVPGVGEVAGVLRSRDGTPLGGQDILVLHATEATELGQATSDPTTGAFVVSNLPVGPVRLQALLVQGYASYWTWSRAEVDAVLTEHGVPLEQDALGAFGALDPPVSWQVWQRRAAAGENVHVLLIGTEVGAHPALADPRLDVYGPDGTLVASNDDRTGSDPNAEVSFTAPEDGVYAVLVRAADGGGGAYRLASHNRDESDAFRASEPAATVVGTLRLGGALEVGHVVRLVVDGRPVLDTRTDASGSFELPVFAPAPSPVSVEAVDGEGVVIARQTLDLPPGTTAVDLAAPARVPVTARVTRLGTPVGGLPVTLESDNAEALPEDGRREGTTSAAGEVAASLPIGLIRATATFEGQSYTAEEAGTGPPVLLEIDLPAPPAAVFGTVTGGNPHAPVPGATVELVGFGATSTDAAGTYHFDLVPAGTYTLRASLGTATAETGVQQEGSDVQAELTLPISILRGRVVEPDGSGAEATIEACSSDLASQQICVTTASDVTGEYAFYGLPSWRSGYASIWATLTDGSGFKSSQSFYHYAGQVRTYQASFYLPETGSLVGVVHGDPLPATVWLAGFPYAYGRSTTTEADGSFAFTHVWPAAGSVAAEDAAGIPTAFVPATVVARQETSVELWTVPRATLELSLVDEAGAALPGTVDVEVPEAPLPSSPGGSWLRSVELADPEGVATVQVPAGLFRVVSADRPRPGAADGVLDADDVRVATLQRGTHAELPEILEGPVGSYATDQWTWCEEPCGRLLASAVANGEPDPPFLHLEAEGRAFRSLLTTAGDARVRRQYYVPASGLFARTLTLLTNPTLETISVSVTSSFQSLEWADGLIDEAGPDGVFDVNDVWAAYRIGGTAVGWASGDLVLPLEAYEEGGEVGAAWRWTHSVEIPPGETRALLAFSVHRKDDDGSALVDTLRRLTDLTEPGALEGLTAAEREAIVNFDVPPLGEIEGTVTDQGAAVEGARVAAFSPVQGLTSEVTTDGAGAFTLAAVRAGPYSVVAVEPLDGRPGRLDVDVAVGSPTPAPVAILGASGLGGIHVAGTLEGSGQPASGAVVELWAEGYSPVWAPSAVLDANGEADFAHVPPGPVEVRWAAPYGGDPAAVVVAAGAVESAVLTATQQPVFPPVDLSGGDGIPYTVDGFTRVTLDQGCVPLCGTDAYFEDWSGEAWDAYAGFATGTALNGGREVSFGPQALTVSGLQATRRVFVPPSGRFARILDILHNPGSSDVTLLLDLQVSIESNGADWVAETSSGDGVLGVDDRFVVFSANDTRVVSYVVQGPGSVQPPDVVYGGAGFPQGFVATAWDALRVPAGGSSIVLQFVAVREAGETAAAWQQAADLADLTDPEALAGLSEAERALIVNFEVP